MVHGPRRRVSHRQLPRSVWPAVDADASLAGVIGGALTLALVLAVGYWLRRRKAGST